MLQVCSVLKMLSGPKSKPLDNFIGHSKNDQAHNRDDVLCQAK